MIQPVIYVNAPEHLLHDREGLLLRGQGFFRLALQIRHTLPVRRFMPTPLPPAKGWISAILRKAAVAFPYSFAAPPTGPHAAEEEPMVSR